MVQEPRWRRGGALLCLVAFIFRLYNGQTVRLHNRCYYEKKYSEGKFQRMFLLSFLCKHAFCAGRTNPSFSAIDIREYIVDKKHG